MRLGISSANASDNYTYCHLESEGGTVLNGSLQIQGDDGLFCDPVSVVIKRDERPSDLDNSIVVILQSDDSIGTKGKISLFISRI